MRPARPTPHRVDDLAAAFGLEARAVPPDLVVTSVTSDSRSVVPGDLLVALPGARTHGARHAAEAWRAGAVAVLTDPAGAALLGPEVPVLMAADPRALLGPVAAAVHDHPARALRTYAVTGTNGKTTTTYLLDRLEQLLGRRTGLVGTVQTRSGDRVLPSRLTTPEADELQGVLAVMRQDGVESLAMEVSSHALVARRVDGLVFDVAGFTNLSQDHLDFHGDMDSYLAAKARLFTPEHARRGVVVVDGPWGRRLVSSARIPVVTLAPAGQLGTDADWRVDGQPDGFRVRHRDGRTVTTSTTLPGAFNVTNAALALVMAVEAGTDPDELQAALDRAGGLAVAVPGRMEVMGRAPRVVVDFAHNPEALARALDALAPSTAGRLVVVFGATGERDTGKRPLMGRVAAERADIVVVTDDDPHGEAPGPIRAAVLFGARSAGRAVPVHEIASRADAIARTIAAVQPQDTVLVAGRGHETVQDVDGVDVPLDDRTEARRALAARTSAAAGRP